MPGTIELVIGPMRSNKTAELTPRVAMREEYAAGDGIWDTGLRIWDSGLNQRSR